MILPLRGEGVYRFTLECLSVSLSVTNFCRIFPSNYKSQRLEILTHSLFMYNIWWDSHLYKSDVNFLSNDDFANF